MTVVGVLELGGWDVAAVLVQAAVDASICVKRRARRVGDLGVGVVFSPDLPDEMALQATDDLGFGLALGDASSDGT